MRKAPIERKTKEVDIKGSLNIDGRGKNKIKTGFTSLDHMLELFAFHGLFDLELQAKGDLQHHILEDIGIALGDAFKKAIGKAEQIKRYGFASIPMDKIVANVNVDISGRPTFVFSIGERVYQLVEKSLDLTTDDFKTFLDAFVSHARISLIIKVPITGEIDSHHALEAIFKALGISLDQATQIDPRRKGIPSTKGIID